MNVTRRQIVKTLSALGAGSVFLSLAAPAAAQNKALSLVFGEGATLQEFTTLSKIVTLRDDLPQEALEKMYAVFKGEPWMTEHVAGLNGKIRRKLEGSGEKRPPMKDPAWKFSDGEKWFASHLLTTWYLGIYYHEERPTQRVLFEDALMFDALRGVLPVTYLEPTGFGNWAEPPKEAP